MDKARLAASIYQTTNEIRFYLGNGASEDSFIIKHLRVVLSALEDADSKIDGCKSCLEQNCGNCGSGRIDDGYCATAKLETFSEESRNCWLHSWSTGNYCQNCGRKLKD